MAAEEATEPARAAGHQFVDMGWHVVPLHSAPGGVCSCNDANCSSPGKHPIPINGLHGATNDHDDVDYYWDTYPHANIGIVCGPSNLAIVDIDSDEAERRYLEVVGTTRKANLVVRTGHGYHLYYTDTTHQARPSVGRDQDKGIDLRAGSSYVVAPPSIHATGAVYRFTTPVPKKLENLPLAVAGYFAKRHRTATGTSSDGGRIGEGGRDHTLTSLAGSMRKRGLTEAEIFSALRQINHDRCDPPLDERDVRRIARSVAGYESGAPVLRIVEETGTTPKVEDDSPDMFPVETWETFRDTSPQVINWHIHGLVPHGGLVFIASPPKAGKTWLAIAMALAAATGRDYLGSFAVPTAIPVLYVALEGHRAALRARIGSIARGMGIDPAGGALGKLHVAYKPVGINISDPIWAGRLTHQAAKIGAELIIIDVLRAAAPGMREDGNGAQDFAILKANLTPILATGASIGLLHHFVKLNESNRSRSIGERMSGSGALFGHADLVLGITSSEEGARRMRIETMSRDAAGTDPFGVVLEGEGTSEHGGFGFLDTLVMRRTDDVPKASTIKASPEEIRDWIAAQPNRDASPKQIRDTFGISDKTLLARRDALLALGVKYGGEGSTGRFVRYWVPR